MFKRYLRWIAPLIALVVLTTCMAFATLMYTHAAAPTIHTHIPSHTISQPYNLAPHGVTPNMYRRG
jgi:hypothetical protein